MKNSISRRCVLKGTGALLAGAAFSTRVMAAAPPPEPVTPELIEAAGHHPEIEQPERFAERVAAFLA